MQRLHNVPLTLGYSVQHATLVDPVWSHSKTLTILWKSKWKVQSVTFKSNPYFSWCVERIAKVCGSLRYSWTWSLTVNVRVFRIDYPCLFYYQPAATATTVAIHQNDFVQMFTFPISTCWAIMFLSKRFDGCTQDAIMKHRTVTEWHHVGLSSVKLLAPFSSECFIFFSVLLWGFLVS